MNLYPLVHDSGFRATILDYGGIVTSLWAPDRTGRLADVVLGYDTPEAYVASNKPYLGAIIGRFANRIARGRFTLDGVTYQLARNNGPNHLHGGVRGFDKHRWTVTDHRRDHLALTRLSPDGEEGYPGNLTVEVVYTLQSNTLRIEYQATTDRPTILNLTNHSYFDLSGTGDIGGHSLQLFADTFTPVDPTQIPTGELRPVAGTPFDFRTPTPIGLRIDADDEQLRIAGGYDHNYVLSGGPLAARVTEPTTGRILEVRTTEPGLQLYTGNSLDGSDGHPRRSGFCLEAQHFPDAPNQPRFPPVVLRPGEIWRHWTEYRFGVS